MYLFVLFQIRWVLSILLVTFPAHSPHLALILAFSIHCRWCGFWVSTCLHFSFWLSPSVKFELEYRVAALCYFQFPVGCMQHPLTFLHYIFQPFYHAQFMSLVGCSLCSLHHLWTLLRIRVKSNNTLNTWALQLQNYFSETKVWYMDKMTRARNITFGKVSFMTIKNRHANQTEKGRTQEHQCKQMEGPIKNQQSRTSIKT